MEERRGLGGVRGAVKIDGVVGLADLRVMLGKRVPKKYTGVYMCVPNMTHRLLGSAENVLAIIQEVLCQCLSLGGLARNESSQSLPGNFWSPYSRVRGFRDMDTGFCGIWGWGGAKRE